MDRTYDRIYTYHSRGGDIPVRLRECQYEIGFNLCLRLIGTDGTTYATLTKCFFPLQDGYAFVDIPNLPEAEDFINRNGLGKFAGKYWGDYPLYRFFLDTVRGR